ncbi:MAG: hypothetical protein [Myoviridae sp. ctThM1]|nr:MAG: hypothetical protein [Myoviridae sp. ctThM1]
MKKRLDTISRKILLKKRNQKRKMLFRRFLSNASLFTCSQQIKKIKRISTLSSNG